MYRVPRNEARRLAAVRERTSLEAAARPVLARVARLAARHFDMPMAAVTVVDEHRVRLLAAHGLPLQEEARENSICTHAILHRGVMVVPDLWADDRLGHRVAVVGTERMRFYAGAPLRTTDGCALGALCVMDNGPRPFTREDEAMLVDFAALAMVELDHQRRAWRHGDEVRRGQQTRRTLARQDRLIQRLGEAREEHLRLAAEWTQLHETVQAEAAELRLAKEGAERANTAKSEFLLRMSHELRTPLNAILGFGQILQGTVSVDTQRTGATHVVMAGRHLLSLINEVLDIARIEAGRLDLALEPVRVADVVVEALDLIRPLANHRRIVLETWGGADPVQTVCADRQRLKQVLLNLLSNAVKYSPETGRVMTHWRVERNGALRLCVSDEGPGIARDQAARLFVAFERLGAENTDIPGTGLGLALSKRLVEAMHGRIGVRGEAGRGSTFWVRLPLWEEASIPSSCVVPKIPVV